MKRRNRREKKNNTENKGGSTLAAYVHDTKLQTTDAIINWILYIEIKYNETNMAEYDIVEITINKILYFTKTQYNNTINIIFLQINIIFIEGIYNLLRVTNSDNPRW